MAVGFFHYILLLLVVTQNHVRSQLNDTNATTISPSISPNTTVYFTQYPSTSPLTTISPTFSPTIKGCSAIHGYVQTSLTTIGNNGQISSYPVRYGPYTYRLKNISMIAFPAFTGTELDPCNKSNFNIYTQDIANKVVLLDGTLMPLHCHYQQWTLNFQNLGAKAVLIDVHKPFTDYKTDNMLQDPRIPTRLIDINQVLPLTSALCGLPGPDFICNQTDIRITLDCFNNTAPALICIEFREYDEQYRRITGEYEQLIVPDDNGHPVWQQDSTFNINENIDWRIYFETDKYFNWVIGETSGEGTSYQPVAYCNDSITADPTDCLIWYEKPIESPFQISSNIIVNGELCPAPDPLANTTYYCVQSRSPDMNTFTGTYVQQIDGVAEWFFTNKDGVVSYLHWTEFWLMSSGLIQRFGWKMNVGTVIKASCIYSELDVSINNSYIKFVPTLCTDWVVGANPLSQIVDHTFVMDSNECAMDMDSNASMICVAYSIDDVYSEWSGVYTMDVLDGYGFVYNHRVWTFTVDDDIYSILYSAVMDAWIVTMTQVDIIYARCVDKQGIYNNPVQCSAWSVVNESMNVILMMVIESVEECETTILQTTSTETTDSGEGGGKNKTAFAGFSMGEYIAIGAALLVFPICIACFVCYQKRKVKKHGHDDGISLQPYVPTGMAYDSYKQNKTHQAKVKQAKKKKVEKEHKKKIRLKVAAPTSVASASVDVGEDHDTAGENGGESTMDSTQALINVYDEDDAIQPNADDMIGTDTDNPFLRDDILRTGQTIDETHHSLKSSDLMNVFDD